MAWHTQLQVIIDCHSRTPEMLNWLDECNPNPPKPYYCLRSSDAVRVFFYPKDISTATIFTLMFDKHISHSNMSEYIEMEQKENDKISHSYEE